jgi:hypothetical protein
MGLFSKAFRLILGHWVFVRNERAGSLLENFFISAVVSVLVIRLYLRLAAGTPRDNPAYAAGGYRDHCR